MVAVIERSGFESRWFWLSVLCRFFTGRRPSGAVMPLTFGAAFCDHPDVACYDGDVCATGDDYDFATSRRIDVVCCVDEEDRLRRRIAGRGGYGYARRYSGSDRQDLGTDRPDIDSCSGSDCDWLPTFGVVLAGIFGIFLPAATTNKTSSTYTT